jgi:hypothetical protein
MKYKFAFGCAVASLVIAVFLTLPARNTSANQDQPTIAKDSVQVTAFTVNQYKGNWDHWSWLPLTSFRVNGPIPSGGQLYVEFPLPTGPWVSYDCATEETQVGYWWKVNCGGRDIGEEKASTYTGPISFAIKLRNELAGTNVTLFNGKAKVEKAKDNEFGPKSVNHWVYFINHDWNLPIGYVSLNPKDRNYPNLQVAFWVRGDSYKLDPHVFYQGKEVGRISIDGTIAGSAGCGAEVENNTTHYVEDKLPQKAKWARVICDFPNVMGSMREKPSKFPGQVGDVHILAENPGEYEVKILRANKLARSLKFTVAPGGSFENGIAKNSKLGSDRVIVPVQIIGDQDGIWDRNAWRDAFYGNPLVGFTPLP